MKKYIYPKTAVMPAQPFSFLMASPGGGSVTNKPQPSGDSDEV